MQEYSRILIEEYCRSHQKTKKAALLWKLLELSYSMDDEPSDYEMIQLEKLIVRERNPELREALEDMDELFGW